MRDGDSGGHRHGAERRDAWDDLEVDSGLHQCERLLAAAAEDERVAPLQAHDVETGPPVPDEQGVDLLLCVRLVGDLDRIGRGLLEELRRDESIVDEHLAGSQEVEPTGGDQAGIAWACSDEVDAHLSASSTSAWK